MTESTKPAEDLYALQSDPTAAESLRLEPAEGEAEVAGQEKEPAYGWIMVRELVETVVLSLIIFLLIRQVVQNYRIENHSMEPNFYEGQFVLVNKLAYRLGTPTRGDVVVFHNPRNTNEDYIKRIVGVSGDTVEVRDKTVFINGQALPEDFTHFPIPPGEFVGPIVVGDNQLFVMGDNRPNSSDSRVFGPIDQDLVVGQAWLRIWPLNVFGIVQHEDLAPAGVLSQ
ncbi:MAG: signal peptidase I [Caldilineaceae bacterium]|jgi:signal peptidase I|nr:signal peptidase I [Caldilineaceae bacterium]